MFNNVRILENRATNSCARRDMLGELLLFMDINERSTLKRAEIQEHYDRWVREYQRDYNNYLDAAHIGGRRYNVKGD